MGSLYQRCFPFYAVLFFIPAWLSAQCPLTVSAGPDKFVCGPGGQVELDGSISGTEIGFRWTPATGLSDPLVLNPTATVNGPVTYTLTAGALDPTAPNLVNNPGFEAGNTGFTSNFAYNPMIISPGTYVITTSPALVSANFPPCDDHTYGNGTGNLMLINGNGAPSSQVWCQTIPVMANSWYTMSAWVLCSPISPPIMRFSVNGTPIGTPYPVVFGLCDWQEFSATWFSGSATSATLCILDINGGGLGLFGDDFALDDIFMAKACTVSDQVSVSIATVNAVLPASIVLPCHSTETGMVLNGSASSSGPGITYAWDGPGILSGSNTPQATINEPGVYTLTVSFDTGNGICTDVATITVLPDPNVVVASASAEDISCLTPKAMLNGAGSSVGGTITYLWEPASGIVSGNGTLTPLVNQPGVYTLTVTNTLSGCTATAAAEVLQNTTPASAAASAPGPLSCSPSTLTLSGAGSSVGGDFSYQWIGPAIVSGATSLNNCVVGGPGMYTLFVTNELSGCTAAASVAVSQNNTPPLAFADSNAPGILTCQTDSLLLNSSGSSAGPNISYLWSSPNGHFAGPVHAASTTVDSLGLYILTVTNTVSGCSAKDTVLVSANRLPPAISIAAPLGLLNCSVDSVQIDASASSAGPGFSFGWTGGNILSGDSTLSPWVDSAGQYILTITNGVNGCTATDTVVIGLDTIAPTVLIAVPGQLNCQNTLLSLDASASSSGPGLGLQWSYVPLGGGSGPGLVSGDTTLSPQVNAPGWYTLSLIDSLNHCQGRDSVLVEQDILPPQADAGTALTLDCSTTSVLLDGSASSQGANFTYQWTGGATTLTLPVSAPGTYTLTVINTGNGCSAADSVNVTLLGDLPAVAIAPADTLSCLTLEVLLSATASAGPEFVYQWSFSGSGAGIVSGDSSLTPSAASPGMYVLTVTNTTSGCTSSAGVTVSQSVTAPTADAGPGQTLLCGTPSVFLDGSLSSAGTNIAYAWSTTTGNIVQGASTLQPEINAPGTYTLVVTDTSNGCTGTADVLVLQDANAPVADAGPSAILSCTSPSALLDGSNSSTGASLTYLWTTADGVIVSGETGFSPAVAAAGTYLLLVTNTANNCQSLASVQVLDSTQAPLVLAAAPQTLSCTNTAVALSGAGSNTGANIIYLWTGPGLLSGANTLSPSANAAGTYTLTVTNTANGCSATATATLAGDNTAPIALAAAPQTLSCTNTAVALSGAGSSTGANIIYLWTGPGLLSGANTLSPTANAAGTYTLTVTNTANGCSASATATLTGDNAAPTALAAAPQTLSCTNTAVALSGAGSSTGPNIIYLWTGPGLLSGANTLSPSANAAGTYTLTVTNTANGCSASTTATLAGDNTAPSALAAAPQTLSCTNTAVALSGAGSSTGASIIYLWTGPGLLSGASTLSPTANVAGTYALTVTNSANGCSATASATLAGDNTAPSALAAAPQTLSCTNTAVALSGAGSSTGANIIYLWTGPGLISGANTLSPTANAAGTYILTVTNTANGCSASVEITVIQNTELPAVSAGPALTLTCMAPTVTLQGASGTPGVQFIWSTPDGNI
ncbi:MAG: hypothetical protein IT260_19705, partial [Saprospiraceae bacterium]|nr:hypothetical protein [Saprospiraceae bacterium]